MRRKNGRTLKRAGASPQRAKGKAVALDTRKEEIGSAIKQFRDRHGLPASHLSKRFELSGPRAIYAMESGQYKASHEILVGLLNMAAEIGDWESSSRFLALLEIKPKTIHVLADSVRSKLARSAEQNYALPFADGAETRDLPNWLISNPANTRFQKLHVPLASDFFRPGDLIVIDSFIIAPDQLVGEIAATNIGGDPAIGIVEVEELFGETHYYLRRYDEARVSRLPIAVTWDERPPRQIVTKRELMGRVVAWFPAAHQKHTKEKE